MNNKGELISKYVLNMSNDTNDSNKTYKVCGACNGTGKIKKSDSAQKEVAGVDNNN